MAYTNLTDAFVPEVFTNAVQNNIIETNRLLTSGILTPDPDLGGQLLQPGYQVTVPFVNDLGGSADLWSDNSDIAVNNITSGSQIGVKFYQAKAFGYSDKAQLVSSADYLTQIASRFGAFWNRQDEKSLVNVLTGIFGVSKIAEAKLYDQTAKTPSAPQFGAKGFLGAIGLMGDLQDNAFSGIAVNSAVYTQMKAQNLIDTIQPAQGGAPINTYNGVRIIVDDAIPVDLTDKTKPTSTAYIFANGSVRYSSVLYGSETKRDPLAGGGQNAIVQKRVGTMHVVGTSIAKNFAGAEKGNPTSDELAKASTWTVADGIDLRNIGVVAYKAQLDPSLTPGATVATVSAGSGK